MPLKLYFFGKSREINERENELIKRIGFREKIELVALPQAGTRDNKKNKTIEADNFLSKIKENQFIIAFDEHGQQLNSLEFSRELKKALENHKQVVFVIGGAFGLGEKILNKANLKLSMGKMVWTRNLARQMALEQIYRALEIAGGSNFHK